MSVHNITEIYPKATEVSVGTKVRSKQQASQDITIPGAILQPWLLNFYFIGVVSVASSSVYLASAHNPTHPHLGLHFVMTLFFDI